MGNLWQYDYIHSDFFWYLAIEHVAILYTRLSISSLFNTQYNTMQENQFLCSCNRLPSFNVFLEILCVLWIRIPLRKGVLNTTLCDKVCQWLAASRWFSPGTPASSSYKTDCHDIIEILLKVALNTITITNQKFCESIIRIDFVIVVFFKLK